MFSNNTKVLLLLILSTAINYYTPNPNVGFDFSGQQYTINRLSMAFFSALVIGITDIYIHREEFTTENLIILTFLFILFIGLTYYIIEAQLLTTEEEYLLTMKENHKMDLHISESILKKPDINSHGKKYSNNIISTRQEEITHIDKLLKNDK